MGSDNAGDVPLTAVHPRSAGGLEDEPTRAGGTGGAPDVPPGWPAPGWARYRPLRLLGAGGMGRVFEAFDPALQRPVAVKFLSGTSPEMVERFLREARSQARVEHPNVCRVYEVGEVAGTPFIAMQLIGGRSLGALAPGLSLEEKVLLVAEVAEALHAAHRTGLIHRDLKPANVMVETDADGRLHPFVVDFGLARDVDSQELTATGVAVGTPAFMAPEQATGSARGVDRRSDVWGLGATLFALLTGRPPFVGATAMEVLAQLLEETAPALRSVVRSVPRDLETIVMKCLERDPGRRYASAQELAQDLRRFSDGEPIVARPASLVYRLARRAHKHRTLVAVSALALAGLAVAGGVALHARATSAAQARLAEELGEEVERVDADLHSAYLLPLHDIRPELERVRGALVRIEQRMDAAGRVGAAPGHLALGRGELALGNLEAARAHLEQAWELGLRGPDVAASLGLACGLLYQQELEAAARIADLGERDGRLRRAERELREPALRFLRSGLGAGGADAAYLEGLLALCEGRLENALERARSAAADPSHYQARILEGDIHTRRASALAERGEPASARAEFALADAAYRAAARVGESDPRCTLRLASLWGDAVLLDLYGSGGDLAADYATAMAASDASLAADPDQAAVYALRAHLCAKLGEYEYYRGSDPTRSLERASAEAERATGLEPGLAWPRRSAGWSQLTLAWYRWASGADPRPAFAAAVAALSRACELDPGSATAQSQLGEVFHSLGEWQAERGEDPRPSLDQGGAHHDRAAELAPDDYVVHNNRGLIASVGAEYELEHGLDPSASLDRAEACFERSVRLNPGYRNAHSNLGNVLRARGLFAASRGRDPLPDFERAAEAYERALAINSRVGFSRRNLGQLQRYQAEHLLATGGQAEALLRRAAATLDQAIDINPRNASGYTEKARLEVLWQRLERGAARSPLEHGRRAEELGLHAATLNPSWDRPQLVRGLAALEDAAWMVERGDDPRTALARARAALEAARERNQGSADIPLAFARLAALEARQRLRRGASPAAEVEAGLAAVDRALAIDPSLAAAGAARGALQLVAARAARDPASRRELAGQALASLTSAVEANRFLARELEPLLAEARTSARGVGPR